MLKRVRFVFSAALIAILSVSTLILSKPAAVKACPPPPPDTLLALYLRSDLIFLADVTDEKDGEILDDQEDYLYVEILRNLKISSVFKGKPKKNFVFTDTEYRDKKPSENPADTIQITFFQAGYKGSVKVEVGERYLFFFKKDTESETEKYELTDRISGFKKLSSADLHIYKKRIGELEKIVEKKENQLEAITEWLVRCVEEPATRWDGIFDLRASFESLKNEEEPESDEKEPFVIDEDFYSYTPEIAAALSDSQKQRISGFVYSSIQQEMSKNIFYYSLSNLVANWDKPQLAMYAYSFLQTADPTDAERTRSIMEYISNVIDDEELSDLVSSFPVSDESEKTEELIIEEKTEIVTEQVIEVEEPTEPVENTEQETDVLIEKTESSETPQPTLSQKREKVLQEFISRYEHLLARGFQPEAETELAEN